MNDNDNGHSDHYTCTGKDVLRDVGRRHLGVVFVRPWPKCNGEIHIFRSRLKPTLQSPRTIKKNSQSPITINLISDINECEDPAIASRCVKNAECCNLPSHFLCKCKPGFTGDGEVECKGKSDRRESDGCVHVSANHWKQHLFAIVRK